MHTKTNKEKLIEIEYSYLCLLYSFFYGRGSHYELCTQFGFSGREKARWKLIEYLCNTVLIQAVKYSQ